MSDKKYVIEIQAQIDEAQSRIDELCSEIDELKKKRDEEAEKASAAREAHDRLLESFRAQEKVVADLNETIRTSTGAHQDLIAKHGEEVKELNRLREALAENDKLEGEAARAAAETAKAISEKTQELGRQKAALTNASGALGQFGKGMGDAQELTKGMGAATRSLALLMKGDFVGAVQSARTALVALGNVFTAHPILTIAAAIGLAVAAITRKVMEARNAAREAAAVNEEMRAKINAGVMKMRLEEKESENIKGVGSLSDADLEDKLKAARKRADDYSLKNVTAESFSSEQGFQNWQDQKKYWEDYAKALENEKAARDKAKQAAEDEARARQDAINAARDELAAMDEQIERRETLARLSGVDALKQRLEYLNKDRDALAEQVAEEEKVGGETEATLKSKKEIRKLDADILELIRQIAEEEKKAADDAEKAAKADAAEKARRDREDQEKHDRHDREITTILRGDVLDQISDPVEKLKKQKEFLEQDLKKISPSEEGADVKKLELLAKIRDIERDISKEKQKQADDEAKARKALRESIEDYDAQGDRQAQYQLARKRAKEALAAVEAARLNVRMNDTAENREALLDAQKEAVSAMQTYRSAREAAMEDAAGDSGPIDPSDRAALARRARAKADAADAEVRRASHGFVATQGGGKFWTRNNSLSFDMLNRQAQARALAERLERGGSVWEGLGSMGADGRRWVGSGSIGQALARKAEEMKLAEESPEKQMAKNVEKSKDFLEEIRDLLK